MADKINAYRSIVPKSMNFYPIPRDKEFMIQNVASQKFLQFNVSDRRFYWSSYIQGLMEIDKTFLFTYDANKTLFTSALSRVFKSGTQNFLGFNGQVALNTGNDRVFAPSINEYYNQGFEFRAESNSLYLEHIATGKFIKPANDFQAIGHTDRFDGYYNGRINIIYKGRGWNSAPHCTFKIEGKNRDDTIKEASENLKKGDIIYLRGAPEMNEFWPEASNNYVNMENISYGGNINNIFDMKILPTEFKVVSVTRAEGTKIDGSDIIKSYDRIVLSPKSDETSKLSRVDNNGLLGLVQTGEPTWQIISQLSFRGQPIKYKDTVMLFFGGNSDQALTRNSNGYIQCTSDMYCTDPFYGIDNDALFDPKEFSLLPRVENDTFPFFELPVKEFYKRYPFNMDCVRRNQHSSIRGEEKSAWYNIYAPPGYASLGDFGFDFPRMKTDHSGWDNLDTRSSKHILSWPNTSPYNILFVSISNTYNTNIPTVIPVTDKGGLIMNGDLQRCERNKWTPNGNVSITSPSSTQEFISMGYTFSDNRGWVVPETLINYYPDNSKAGARVRTYLLNKIFVQDILNIVQLVPPGNTMFNGGVPDGCDFDMNSTTYSSGYRDSRKIYHMFKGCVGAGCNATLNYFIIFPIPTQLKCCRREAGYTEKLQCGTDTGDGYDGNLEFKFNNRCRDAFSSYCKAESKVFTSKDCSDYIINQINKTLDAKSDLGTQAIDMASELAKFCGATDTSRTWNENDNIDERFPNVKKFPDLCSCYAPVDYLRAKKKDLINNHFSLIKNDQSKLTLVKLSDDIDPPPACLVMENCKKSSKVYVPGLGLTETNVDSKRDVIQPRSGGVTEQNCSGSVCIQNMEISLNRTNLNNSSINPIQKIEGCGSGYSTLCENCTYSDAIPDPEDNSGLKYIRNKLTGDICCSLTRVVCEFVPNPNNSSLPRIDSDSCVNGIRTITYTYIGTTSNSDCKEAALHLTKRIFQGIEDYLLSLDQQPDINTTDKKISIRSRCSDCITNYTNPPCTLNAEKKWMKIKQKSYITPATNGGNCINMPDTKTEICDENKDCSITPVSDVCSNTEIRTSTFNINSYNSGTGKTCKRVAEDLITNKYNVKPIPDPVNNVLTITSECKNCKEQFNNPACMYNDTTKTWKVVKTSTIIPAQYGGQTCNLQPRTVVEDCPTNKDCEIKTDNIVDICNNETGVRNMKVDILKYSNRAGVTCENKAKEYMVGMTNITKVNDSYLGIGSCTHFKNCELDLSTYKDECNEYKGERSITINVLNETVGTGKKSCEEVAIEIINNENPDIVIDDVSRDGNTVKIISECSKRKMYILITAILIAIILIVGGVSLLI